MRDRLKRPRSQWRRGAQQQLFHAFAYYEVMTRSGCTGQDQAFYLSWLAFAKEIPGKLYTRLYAEFTGFTKERQRAGRTTPKCGSPTNWSKQAPPVTLTKRLICSAGIALIDDDREHQQRHS